MAPSDLRDLGLAAGNVISSREDMFVYSEPKLYIIYATSLMVVNVWSPMVVVHVSIYFVTSSGCIWHFGQSTDVNNRRGWLIRAYLHLNNALSRGIR
jgi:hypothetical protein